MAAVTSTPSGAALVDIGEVCFQAAGDTIRAEIQLSANIATINFRWRSTTYELLGSGSASASKTHPGAFTFAISGTTPDPGQIEGHHTCNLVATLTPPNFNGQYILNCFGGAVPINQKTGQLFVVGCTPAM